MRVYLDYHSSTPVDSRVVNTMLPYYTEYYGNASAIHSIGEEARDAVENARQQVAKIIKAEPSCVHFTSGATEANNIILRNVENIAAYYNFDKPCVITTNSEHSSIRETLNCLFLKDQITIKFLKIDSQGNINLNELEQLLCSTPNLSLVSIIAANNEIGTIHDLERIGKLCYEADVFFHTDATQAAGKTDIDVNKMHIDALSMSAHKIYGPKGVGALYTREPEALECITTGGRQEKVTSGTVNVPGAVGFGKACELMLSEKNEANRIANLRDRLLQMIIDKVKDDCITINGTTCNRLYNNINITISGVPSEALVLGMDDVCISTGSACASGNPKPSHVITALNIEEPECAIRISLGRWTTEQDIVYASDKMADIINDVRSKHA